MSVLQRKQLEDSPLADLHAIASELGLEGFRAMRKGDLISAILRAQGAEDEETEPDEVPADEALESPTGESAPAADAAQEETAEEDADRPAEADAAPEVTEAETEKEPEAEPEKEPEAEPDAGEEADSVAGVLDILANGSGFVRVDPAGQSRGDVYVAPAQIRRCELRAGDEVAGPVRPPRRNERHPSLVRVESVNGADAEPPEERSWFGDLVPVFPSARLPAPSSLKAAPFGRGSRVLIVGPPGAGATSLLREITGELLKVDDMTVQLVLVGVRPEEVTEWRRVEGLDVVGGSFERSPDAQAQAAELAVERAKRVVERGGHVALLVDSLDALPAAARRRVYGSARATEEGGTLTVVATADPASDAQRWATTRIVLEPGGKLSRGASGTLNADRLS
jgi:transcription termination factor Rho